MAGTEKSDGPLFALPNKLPEEGGAPKSEPVAGGLENRPPPPAVTLSLPNNPPVGGAAPEPNSEVPPPMPLPKRELVAGAAVAPVAPPFSVLAGLFAEKSPNF